MTDPDQPFRRPHDAHPSDAVTSGAPEQAGNVGTGAPEGPLILDPELHQSVWKPWQDPAEPSLIDGDDGSSTTRRMKRRGARTAIIVGALGIAVTLVAALVVPRLAPPPVWWSKPLVTDMPTKPEVVWSSAGGTSCPNSPDEDQAILTDTTRVWSIDLTDGTTRWSVELFGYWRITCLPGAGLVAVTKIDSENGSILNTMLLDAASGAAFADLPGGSTKQVIPMGPDIGLLDGTALLRVVDPGNLDETLWSRQLELPTGEVEPIIAEDIDDATMLLSSGWGGFALPLTKADGSSPRWSPGASKNYSDYRRVGDVIVRYSALGDGETVLDLVGRELWRSEAERVGVAGARLYVSTNGGSGYTNLREVEPRTGTTVNDDVYKGWFDFTTAVKGRIAVVGGRDISVTSHQNTLSIPDEHLQEQPTISVEDLVSVYEGQKWVYAESSPGQEAVTQLTAIDTEEVRVLWTLDLDQGQSIDQIGRHLVVVDGDGTLHGLASNG